MVVLAIPSAGCGVTMEAGTRAVYYSSQSAIVESTFTTGVGVGIKRDERPPLILDAISICGSAGADTATGAPTGSVGIASNWVLFPRPVGLRWGLRFGARYNTPSAQHSAHELFFEAPIAVTLPVGQYESHSVHAHTLSLAITPGVETSESLPPSVYIGAGLVYAWDAVHDEPWNLSRRNDGRRLAVRERRSRVLPLRVEDR